MNKTGLVSVTFRNLRPREIIDAVKKAGLDGIEWGSDIHAPCGDLKTAREIANMCREEGLEVLSYGSYFGKQLVRDVKAEFIPVVDSAYEMGAPNIRIWAGTLDSEEVPANVRANMVKQYRAFAKYAQDAGITLSFEYHQKTLTNTPESAVKLIEEIGHPNAYLYWQPNQYKDFVYNMGSLKTAMPYVSNVHVFNWAGKERYSLSEGNGVWGAYLHTLNQDGKDRAFMLEFVKDGTLETFYDDAETLNAWIK